MKSLLFLSFLAACTSVGDDSGTPQDCSESGPTGAREIWYDGVDQNCDGNDSDADGDGFDALVMGGDDCDDADPGVYPGAPESAASGQDRDCNGASSDGDADGFTAASAGGADCDDADPSFHPGVAEICDGLDNDCDALADDDDPDLESPGTAWHPDQDRDGFGSAAISREACSQPAGYLADASDCDDFDVFICPGAFESCDGRDDDCNGVVDDPCIGPDDARSTWLGLAAYDEAGEHLSGGDDLDGDTLPDLAISSDVGVAWVVPATLTGTHSLSEATATLSDQGGGAAPSAFVRQAGDTDGDGFTDILVSSMEYRAVYLLTGPISGDLDLHDAASAELVRMFSGYPGAGLSGAGDVDGDGFGDILVGDTAVKLDPSFMGGAVWLFHGPLVGELPLGQAQTHIISTEIEGLGRATKAGDLDGDGLDDILVSAYGDDSLGHSGGCVLVFLSPISGEVEALDADTRWAGGEETQYAGWSIAGNEDTNGDGRPDILVGAWEDRAWLLLDPGEGLNMLADASATFLPEVNLDDSGKAIALPGDLDGDGMGDILIGAESAGSDSGRVYVVPGPVSGNVELGSASLHIAGDPDDHAGVSITGVGDVDADGLPDFALGFIGSDFAGGSRIYTPGTWPH